MKVLVTGARGYIASSIISLLLENNHEVIGCVRGNTLPASSDRITYVSVGFGDSQNKNDWIPHLKAVDVVINCAGILRETRKDKFEQVHFKGPQQLARACVESGVKKFIQISALGANDEGAFVASKFKFDSFLEKLDGIDVVILKPSVVVSKNGSYGGTSMLRALAGIPLFLFLPGNGDQKIQPILLEDLAFIVLKSIETQRLTRKSFLVVGPEILTLKQFLLTIRSWLRFPKATAIPVPLFLASFFVSINDKFGSGPLCKTVWTMLKNGNFGNRKDVDILVNELGVSPHNITTSFQSSPSYVQDRWHCRLYLLRSPLWLILILIWIGSGITGFAGSTESFLYILNKFPISTAYQGHIVVFTSTADIVLGGLLLFKVRPRLIAQLMLVSVLIYTVGIAIWAPSLWLDPLGGLLKNFSIMGTVLVYLAIEDMR